MRSILACDDRFVHDPACAGGRQSAPRPSTLRCEYRVDPLGIDVTEPRLSWEMHDARRGAKQTAYQVLVASTPEKLAADQGDLWDSGQVASDQSTQVVYAGKPLQSRMRCYWKVRLWDADGQPDALQQARLVEHGAAEAADFQAKWIGLDGPMTYPQADRASLPSLDGCVWVWTAEPGVNARKRPGRQAVLPRFGDDSAGTSDSPGAVPDYRRRRLRIVRQREAGCASPGYRTHGAARGCSM